MGRPAHVRGQQVVDRSLSKKAIDRNRVPMGLKKRIRPFAHHDFLIGRSESIQDFAVFSAGNTSWKEAFLPVFSRFLTGLPIIPVLEIRAQSVLTVVTRPGRISPIDRSVYLTTILTFVEA